MVGKIIEIGSKGCFEMMKIETRIFTSEDEMCAWLIEKGFEVTDCAYGTLTIEIDGNEFAMNYRKLDDGQVELL